MGKETPVKLKISVAFCYHIPVSQPVKLSDALVLDARITGGAQERSIARQIEFWAKLGRSVDLLLEGRQVLALQRSGGTQLLSEALADVDTPAGRERVAAVLASQPWPHYKQYSGQPGLLVRIDSDGTETVGRFEKRVFVPAKTTTRVRSIRIPKDIPKGKHAVIFSGHSAKSAPASVSSKRTSALRERQA
jgi:hypothetical protein